ncbi:MULTISPECIES: hypothetical protein [Acinetobacter]|uniref:Uncharacterized protein n=1 Tax=Acinetobacter piscicola TaxID=2006115 RepID=A0A7S6VY41_9GAMM|nr:MULTISPECIES: hypothetical protein [Acinetobacter]QOW46993.1 hypothetical protein G0028_14450 [Acinetobacter piscicola]
MTWLFGYCVFAVSELPPEFVYEKFHDYLKKHRSDFMWKESEGVEESFNGNIYFNSQEMYDYWEENLFVLNDNNEGSFEISYNFFDVIDLQTRAIKLEYNKSKFYISNITNPYYYIFPKNIYEYCLTLPAPVEDNDFSNQISKIFLKIFEDE